MRLPGQAAPHEPGQDTTAFLPEFVLQVGIGLAFVGAAWVLHKAYAKLDQTGPRPEGFIACVGVRLVVGHQKQLVCRGKAVLPALQLPCRDVPAAGQELDLRDIEFIALFGFTAPGHAFALQVNQMRGRCTTSAKFVLGEKQVSAHHPDQGPQHGLERVEDRIFPIKPLDAKEQGKDMMGGRAGDAIAQQALQEGNQVVPDLFGLLLENLLQELLPPWCRSIQARPLGWDRRLDVVCWIPRVQLTRPQVQYAVGTRQQPGVGIPLPGGDFQVGLRVSENGLNPLEFLERFGASDEFTGFGLEPFIALQSGVVGIRVLEHVGVQLLFRLGRFIG